MIYVDLTPVAARHLAKALSLRPFSHADLESSSEEQLRESGEMFNVLLECAEDAARLVVDSARNANGPA